MVDTIKKIVHLFSEKVFSEIPEEDILELETKILPCLAEPVVKQVVDLISEKKYEEIPFVAELDSWSIEEFQEVLEGFLELNELPYFDRFDVPCNFSPAYEYHQFCCGLYGDGRGFWGDYALTTDGELNDLTLQMEFLFTDSYTLKSRILDAHVM